MKTLKESIDEYNTGKVKMHGDTILLRDVKDKLLEVYRKHGITSANDILSYFKVSRVEDVKEGDYDMFISMCNESLK